MPGIPDSYEAFTIRAMRTAMGVTCKGKVVVTGNSVQEEIGLGPQSADLAFPNSEG